MVHQEQQVPTILLILGVECYKKFHTINNKTYLIKIWDTCGQERFKSITANFYRNADGVILVFDVSEEESFENLSRWLDSLMENNAIDLPKIIIANKIDLNRTITDYNMLRYRKECEIFECSAKTGANIMRPFESVIRQVARVKRKKDDSSVDFYKRSIENSSCEC